MAKAKDISEVQKAIIYELWEAGKIKQESCTSWMLSVCHLEDNKTNMFKTVQLQFQT